MKFTSIEPGSSNISFNNKEIPIVVTGISKCNTETVELLGSLLSHAKDLSDHYGQVLVRTTISPKPSMGYDIFIAENRLYGAMIGICPTEKSADDTVEEILITKS